MSILDIKKLYKKTVIVYIGTTLFCVLFNYIYSLFSHNVSSAYMQYAFMYSLIGGIGFYSILSLLKIYNRIAYNLYNAAIATLTFGSIFQGIVDISGSDVTYSNNYFILGTALLGISLFILLLMGKKAKNTY